MLVTCHYYRPQRSCSKIMFLHLSVSHSVHGGGGVSQHALGQTPPGQTYPSMHWGRHPTGTHISQHALGQTPPQTYPSMRWDRHPPLGRHIPACTGADTPPPTATAVDGMHPTGMHCLKLIHEHRTPGFVFSLLLFNNKLLVDS